MVLTCIATGHKLFKKKKKQRKELVGEGIFKVPILVSE